MSDPNYILSQEEFHETLAAHARRQLAGEHVIINNLNRQVEGLRKTGGWLAISLACWLLVIGFTILTKSERGRP